MSIAPGTKLGAYDIREPIGAGGMGEVYLAVDTNLGRKVAIKVLPEDVALDADRLARFEREARTLATLNHPNIAAVYGLERKDGRIAMVMELVDGVTLAERLEQGPMPLAEAVPVARQICDGLEAAHDQGIVHRDLKPANIKVRPDGTVKVLDFGLAKPIESPSAMSTSVSMSPTITTPAMTQAGMILGTAAYMSPEQAKGRPTDRRSDIWSFAAVVYEMLTGRRAFEGEDVAETLASVLRSEPDWTALPADTPPALVTFLKRCMQKDRAQRVRDIGDVRLALDGAFDQPLAPAAATTAPPPRQSLIWPAVAALLAAGIAGFTVWSLRPVASNNALVSRFEIPLERGDTMPDSVRPVAGFDLSPDGRTVVFPAYRKNVRQLYRRALADLAAVPIAGTEGGIQPFFSPDGRWLGYFDGDDSTMKKIELAGGAPVELTAIRQEPRFAAWLPGGTIVFAHRSGPLMKVSESGGESATLFEIEKGETDYLSPSAIPGRRAIVYRSSPSNMLYSYDLESGKKEPLVKGTDPRVSWDNRLVFERDGALWAVGFDARSLKVTGEPAQVLARPSTDNRILNFALSNQGTLLYQLGPTADAALPTFALVWVDGHGQEQPLPLPARFYNYPRVSPDGTRIAVSVLDPRSENDLWVYDVRTGAGIRLTHEGNNALPVWTADGQRILFSSTRGVPQPSDFTGDTWWGNLFQARADGSGAIERLTTTQESQALTGISPDGHELLYTHLADATSWQIARVDVASGKLTELTSGPFRRGSAEISPNGRMIAYRSNDTGAYEIYVQPYPALDAKVAVSVGGGLEPIWSADSKSVFYRLGRKVMAVDITEKPLRASAPRELFSGDYRSGGSGARQFHVAPGGRFLMAKGQAPPTATESDSAPFVLVLNWLQELK